MRAIRYLLKRPRTSSAPRLKVSVAVITYNQSQFIAQALDSVLSQDVSFDWEIVVGDDCSTDGTRAILQSYARKYPDRIRLLLHPQRLGPHKLGLEGKNNLLATYRACRGEYVALLEGDDYWTEDRKLQRQVTFLDTHPSCSLCCHAVAVEYSDARVQHWERIIGESSERIYSVEDLLSFDTKPEMTLGSMVFRRRALPEVPVWFEDVFNGDYALQVLLAGRGNVAFLPDCMAAHRKHEGGVSRLYDTDPDFCNLMLLKLHMAINEHFDYRFRSILEPYIENEQRVVAAAAARSLASRPDPPKARIRLSLDEFVPHAGQLERGTHGEAAIVTHSTPWAYGATLRLPMDDVGDDGDGPAYACVRARAEGAPVGIGVLDRGGEHFLDRSSLEPSEVESEVRLGIPRLREAGDLVVQTWGRPDSATVHIASIDLVVLAEVGL